MIWQSELGPAAFEQCALAITQVASRLPDKQQDRTQVAAAALAFINVDADEGERAREIVRRFINSCPRCWGVDRTNQYWNMLLTFVGGEKALELYLIRFPGQITTGQRLALERYLVRKRGYDAAVVTQALQRFVIRQNYGRHAPSGCSFVR